MTVCIAAMCEGGKAIVVASDRMITAGSPMNIEFEHDRKKIDILGDRFIAMSAGDALIGTNIIEIVECQIKKNPAVEISIVGEYLKESYTTIRIKAIEEQLLRPINYSFSTFQSDGQKQIPLQIYAQLIQAIQTFNLGVEFIIAGMIGDNGRIGFVHNPGILKWYDRLGFHAIGSGGIHAIMTLIGHSVSSNIEATIYKVYTAKKNAEIAPGVGNLTDIKIITKDGGIKDINEKTFDELDRIHKEAKEQKIVDLKTLKGVLNAK